MSNLTQSPVAQRLAGTPLAEALLAQIPTAMQGLQSPPKLAIIRVGDNPASAVYVGRKLAACTKVGIVADEIHMAEHEGEKALHSLLHGLAHDTQTHAIIVQLPLPTGWHTRAVLELIPPAKDCDGLTTANMQARNQAPNGPNPTAILPATPLGVVRLLQHIGQPITGQTIGVVGKGLVVGQPLREMLTQQGAHVVAINRDTPHPQTLAQQATVLISATGVPHLVGAAWVKQGAVIIDVGLTRILHNGKPTLLGDVNPIEVAHLASWLTPVPGGVGPLTVASLLTNIVDCTRQQAGLPAYAWHIPPLDTLSPTS